MTSVATPETYAAQAWYDAGCTPIPIRLDGTKAPVGRWEQWHNDRPATLAAYWPQTPAGVAVICGRTSGNLEMLEFEGIAVRELNAMNVMAELAAAAGIADLWEHIRAGYLETSPKGGVHLFYRVTGDTVPGNVRLAQRPAHREEWTAKELSDADKMTAAGRQFTPRRVLVETRGQGGYVIVAPTRAEASDPKGIYGQQPWIWQWGHPSTIATITAAQRDQLLGLCRSFDVPIPRAEIPVQRQPALPYDGTAERPGDEFARLTSWAQILDPHGWRRLYEHGGKTYWCRPGKETGVSATTTEGPNDPGGMWVFTSSTSFEPELLYTKFGAYTHLEHGGDYAAAAGELAGPYEREPLPPPLPDIGPMMPAPAAPSSSATQPAPAPELDMDNPWHAAYAKVRAMARTSATLDDIDPARYVIDGWLRDNEISQIIGASGSMKTFAAIDMAACISTGRAWHGNDIKRPGAVVIIAAEGASGIRKRIRAWEKANRCRLENVHIIPAPMQIATRGKGGSMTGSFEWWAVAQYCLSVQAVALFVDTQARATIGVNENDNSEMGAIFQLISELKDQTRAAVCLIHHTGKNGTGGRGASSMYGAVTGEITVTKHGKVGAYRIVITNTKNKDDEESPTIQLAPETVQLSAAELTYAGTPGDGEEETTSLVLVKPAFVAPLDGNEVLPTPEPVAVSVDHVLRRVVGILGDTRQSATKAEIRSVCTLPRSTFYEAWNLAVERKLLICPSGKTAWQISDSGRLLTGNSGESGRIPDHDTSSDQQHSGDSGESENSANNIPEIPVPRSPFRGGGIPVVGLDR